MANHHTDNAMFNGMNVPGLEESEDVMRKLIGATDRFPDGKISENDEGEIRFSIGSDMSNVHINFGKPVHSMAMSPHQARNIAAALLKHADRCVLIGQKSTDVEIVTKGTVVIDGEE